MNARTKKVLEEALELSAEDRALLAAALEASLDEMGEGDEDAHSISSSRKSQS